MIHETPDVSVVRAEAHVRACAGFSVLPSTAGDDRAEIQELHAHLARWGLQTRVRHRREKASAGVRHRFFLDLVDVSQELIAELDTAALTRELAKLNSDSHSSVEAEIWLAWLVSPGLLEFPSFAELFAQFRIRCAIVDGASKTLVDFHAHAVNRPASHWTYIEDVGFRLNAGKPLLEGLRLALHPETPEKRYAFSCYRASEYVLLLGLAGEAERSNPALFSAIEAQWLQGPLMAARFEAAFLSPVGTAEHPLPKRWYVPGDRVWFRNPEPVSSDVAGYEGSFVLYLGRGHFGNFWKLDKPFTIEDKLYEIYCWRFGVCTREGAEAWIDDDLVDLAVAEAKKCPRQMAQIIDEMYRYRDPYPENNGGGAIDYRREVPRFVLPASCNVTMPV